MLADCTKQVQWFDNYSAALATNYNTLTIVAEVNGLGEGVLPSLIFPGTLCIA